MGIFIFTYGSTPCQRAANVKPCVGLDAIEEHLLQPETSDAWDSKNGSGRRFQRYGESWGYPGHHASSYNAGAAAGEAQSLRQKLTAFLDPHSTPAVINEADAVLADDQGKKRTRHGQHPYHVVQELRMDAREWLDDAGRIKQGTHYPLCIKYIATCRRSRAKKKQRFQKKWTYRCEPDADVNDPP